MNPKIQYLLDTLQAFAPVPNEIYIIHSSLFRASPIKEDLKDTYENLKEIKIQLYVFHLLHFEITLK